MRTWLWSLVLLTAAVVMAVVLRENTGHVLILVNDWRLQVSLAFAVVSLFGLFVLVYWLLRVSAWLAAIPIRVRSWSTRRHVRRDQELLEQGWTELLEGRYSHAEKDLTKLFGRSKDAGRQVLAALSAARAAHALGEFGRRDHMLALAKQKTSDDPSHKDAVATAAADLYLDQGLAAQALEELLPLQDGGARHIHSLRLLLRAHRQLNRHDQVFTLARTLNRRGALHDSEARQIIEVAAAARLRETTHSGDWKAFWKDLKSEERMLTDVALAGAAAFEANGLLDDASRALEQSIPLSFDPRLLLAYSRAEPSQVKRRLEKAEAWVQSRPNDPDLLAAIGNLCLIGQIWGQAENYLSRSLSKRADARVHALLGSLFDKLNRPNDAAAQWRMATAVGAALPVLASDSFLPVADTASDPSVLHAEGLAYLSESGFQANWDHQTISDPGRDNLDEYFDSAPVAALGEPAPVTSLAPLPEKKS
ncbi:MAG: protoheme IX synthesis protein [Burkholderiaceae bacterium]|jgi:HemY protein|nr:protoheme IX synthesis protein [Burkholderiaceae bacterium]MDP4969345.1 protoheme IX synthesis protein [Burkholderiaceae bacterium]MDP5111334.1 protoheme IX synthesis protein [Burkholderiaceae bacterium]